jgi:hypothetical protein
MLKTAGSFSFLDHYMQHLRQLSPNAATEVCTTHTFLSNRSGYLYALVFSAILPLILLMQIPKCSHWPRWYDIIMTSCFHGFILFHSIQAGTQSNLCIRRCPYVARSLWVRCCTPFREEAERSREVTLRRVLSKVLHVRRYYCTS